LKGGVKPAHDGCKVTLRWLIQLLVRLSHCCDYLNDELKNRMIYYRRKVKCQEA
jgi:hypothetical protein